MPFDVGFDFRGSAIYVTDPAYGVPVLGETYPHTYTNANGDSINAGWVGAPSLTCQNQYSAGDPRLAGRNLKNTDPDYDFQVDFTSGSAPGAGDYTTAIASGDVGGSNVFFQILDNTTVLIDGSAIGFNNGDYTDAALATYTTANWPSSNTPVAVTFATTTAILRLTGDSFNGPINHFRLTKVASSGKPWGHFAMQMGA